MPVSLLACAGAGAANSAAGGPSSLLTGLAAYWKMDEASGTRADSLGAESLTDVNTVTSAAGKVGNAAQFTAANSEDLEHADDANLSMGAGVRMTIAGWFQFNPTAATMQFAGKWASGMQEYVLYLAASNIVQFIVSSNGAAATSVGTRTPSASALHFLAGRYDGTNISLRVDNNAWENVAYSADIFNGTAVFVFGTIPGAGAFLDGLVDEVGLWKVALTDTQVTNLYNAGAGTTYPFTGIP